MLKAVIFDMDGVIINSEPIHQQAEQQVFDQLGITITIEEHQSFVGMSAKNMWQIIKQKYQLATTLADLMQLDSQYYLELLHQEKEMQPVVGAKELIIALHQASIPLVLASSARRKHIEDVINLFDLHPYFAHVISGNELPQSKPHPAIFTKASQLLNIPSSHCVVIEDAENGVKAAKAAHMHCIGFQNPATGKQNLQLADWVVDDLQQITVNRLKTLVQQKLNKGK